MKKCVYSETGGTNRDAYRNKFTQEKPVVAVADYYQSSGAINPVLARGRSDLSRRSLHTPRYRRIALREIVLWHSYNERRMCRTHKCYLCCYSRWHVYWLWIFLQDVISIHFKWFSYIHLIWRPVSLTQFGVIFVYLSLLHSLLWYTTICGANPE